MDILGEYAQYVEKVRKNAEVIAMSIFEYDKEEEEQKLQATYEKIGEKRGIQIGEKQGELDFTCVFLTVRLLSTYLC